jgi:RNA polymerase sigma factor (sigma-70 family)
MGGVSQAARRPEDDDADADLVRRIRAGDRSAVDDLYDRFRRPAFALARRILGDDGLAEDVLQDVFLSVWRDPAAYDRGRGRFASWVLAVVHHKAVDAVRREESQRRRQHRVEEEFELDAPIATREVEDEAWNRVVAEQVRTALGELSAPQRQALTLAYYGGYTQREVAALTGVPLGTVKTRMLAGMRRLREELGGPGGNSVAGGGLGQYAPVDDGAGR